MRVYIAEKPSLAKVIVAALGGTKERKDGYLVAANGDYVTWCFGHMYEQAAPDDYDSNLKVWRLSDLPIVPDVWQLRPRKETIKQIKVIQSLIGRAKEVVNAGDPDREGQLLVDEVIEELGYGGSVLRVWLQDLTDGGVRAAIQKILPNTTPLYAGLSRSARARSRADWLVGMNLSRAYTLAAQNCGLEGVISVGRVQTPTLALVVHRDRDIEAFASVSYFGIEAEFEAPEGVYKGFWQPNDAVTDEHGRCLKRGDADIVLSQVNEAAGCIVGLEAKEGRSIAPLPYTLSGLQVYCSAKWGMSAQRVLDVAQALYEKHKVISYPRTDCGYLSVNQHAEASGVLASLSGSDPVIGHLVDGADLEMKGRAFNDKKVGAHTGIIPTQQRVSVSDLSKEELNLYDAIRRRYLAQFYPVHQFLSTVILTEVAGETFKTTGKTLLNPGWRVVISDPDEKKDDEEQSALPSVTKDAAVAVIKSARQDKKTKPPGRWTEGTLIKAMANISKYVENPDIKKRLKETSGIGTEATRAGIIETLKRRVFVKAKGKQLISTELGRGLIDALPESVSSPETTALWEQALESIAGNSLTLDDFTSRQVAWVEKQIEISSTAKFARAAHSIECPECGKGILRRRKSGRGYFWGCSKYPECKATYQDKKSQPDIEVPRPECPVCGDGVLRQRNGKKGKFWGCTQYPACTATYNDSKGVPQLS
ncbi:MAG: DNA topoisomerase 3 [Sedimenticola sp.]